MKSTDEYIRMKRSHLDLLVCMTYELNQYMEDLRKDRCPVCRNETTSIEKECPDNIEF